MPTADAGTSLFLKRWLRRPFAVGAVLPSGPLLGKAMAKATLAAMAGREGHAVELGSGTGEISKALLAAGIPSNRLAMIEYDPELATFLRRNFRGPRIIEGDASKLSELLSANGVAKVSVIVSCLPLLSLPAEVVNGIVEGAFKMLPRGGVFVQFTYGPASPVPKNLRDSLKLDGRRGPRIWRNVPPAVVWTFTRPAGA